MSLDLATPGSRDRTVAVQEGDTVYVPKGNTFFVFGEVKKPGAYQLDRDTSILEGITIAGGFTDKAAPGRARVIRKTRGGPDGARRGHERHHQAGAAGPRLPAPGE